MIACQIKEIKSFMNILLATETFDKFLFEEGTVTTFMTTSYDGTYQKDYFDTNEEQNIPFIQYQLIRPILFDHIKGKKTPLSFQFTLHASPTYAMKLITQNDLNIDPALVRALLFHVRFEHGTLRLITGTSFATFVMDKSLEQAWDQAFLKSLDVMHISYELL